MTPPPRLCNNARYGMNNCVIECWLWDCEEERSGCSLSALTSLGSCSTISAALLRNATAQLAYKANRHFLNNSSSSAPPLKSPSGITGRGWGGGCFITSALPGSVPALVSPLRFLLTMIQVKEVRGRWGRLSPQPKSERGGRGNGGGGLHAARTSGLVMSVVTGG